MTNEQTETRREWLPRTNQEKLIKIDGLLAGIVVGFGVAVDRAADLLPGHSGRPAGNGEPGGGSGGFGDTVVERQVIAADGGLRARPAEARALDDLVRLAERVVVLAVELARIVGRPHQGPLDNGPLRRLVWARWALRSIEGTSTKNPGVMLPGRIIDRLWRDVVALSDLVEVYGPPREAPVKRSDELAVDLTEQLCTSHLRIGQRAPRDKRYTGIGLCRWCGDYLAAHGFVPTLEIVDAHENKNPIALARLTRDEKALRAAGKKTKKKGGKRGRR